jgi:HlyD family secretion protein
MHRSGLCLVVLAILIAMISCERRVEKGLFGSGILEGREVLVGSKVAGEVIALTVQEGDMVVHGQSIATIDTSQLVLEKAQLVAGMEELRLNMISARRTLQMAEDQAASARKQYERVSSLFRQGSATQVQYENVETAYKTAQTQLDNARTSLQILETKGKQLDSQLELVNSHLVDARIEAPISGTVLEKYVEPGELVGLGSSIVSLADLKELWIRVYLPETELGRVSLRAKVRVKPDAYPDGTFEGSITWISPKAEFTPKNVQTKDARAALVYAVKVTVPNAEGKLLIGMPAEVYF